MDASETIPARVGRGAPDNAGSAPASEDDPLDQLATDIDARAGAATTFDEHHLVEILTRGFVPPAVGAVRGHELGIVYRPADGEPAGGDLYGAWELPHGRTAVLIGDVAGQGLTAAGTSAMARFFIEALSWEHPDPAAALARTDEILRKRLPPDTFVTAFLGILEGREFRFANAGHPPPAVIRSGGAVEELVAAGIALGVGGSGGWDVEATELAPGELFIAYTDGIAEARRDGEMFGHARVHELAARADTASGPGMLAEQLHEAVRSWAGGLSDDAAVLALRAGPA